MLKIYSEVYPTGGAKPQAPTAPVTPPAAPTVVPTYKPAPVEIPGVPTVTFLKQAMNSVRKARGEKELDAFEFKKLMDARLKELNIVNDMVRRPLNAGFSGGEKKRMEVLQMALLAPTLAILDETDSGLDIDAMKVVAEGVNALRGADRSMLVITHYQRLLDYIVPDHVHVLVDGRIVQSGDKGLAPAFREVDTAEVMASSDLGRFSFGYGVVSRGSDAVAGH